MSKSAPGNQSGVLLFGPGGLRLSGLQANLVPLTPDQFELVNRAKKYATEQSLKNIMNRQVVQQQLTSQHKQQKILQRHHALVLMCRVYVGSISFEVREEMIKTQFSPYGTVKSINMSWDQVTMKHKGFAFVEYDLPEAAQLALEHMNGIQLGGRQIKVGRPSNMPQAEPVVQQIQEECKQENRIYVSNVHPNLNEQELADLFEPFGKVRSCKLALTPNVEQPQHRGCGFIEFESESAATEALTMNNFDLGGTTLYVCRATTPAEMVSIYGVLEAENQSLVSGAQAAQEDIQAQLERANREHERNDHNDLHHNSSSISVGGAGDIDKAPTTAAATNGVSSSSAAPKQADDVSNVLVLKNLVTADDELDESLQLDVYEECSKHGPVTQVVIYVDKRVRQSQQRQENKPAGDEVVAATRAGETDEQPVYLDEVKIFVKYKDGTSSGRAKEALNGRFFAGRKVFAEHYDRELFRRHIYTTTTTHDDDVEQPAS